MKIMIRLSMCLFLLILLIPVPLALAKGSPEKITITGTGLASPIEITDPEILNEFNPWDGKFLDKDRRIVEETPETDTLYEVLFYIRDTSGELHMFYAFKYSPGPSGTRGRIYLPQDNEEWYEMDNQTIARRSGWLYASAEWDALMEHLIKGQRASPSTSASGIASNLITLFMWGPALVIILAGGTVIFWLLWRKRRTPA